MKIVVKLDGLEWVVIQKLVQLELDRAAAGKAALVADPEILKVVRGKILAALPTQVSDL